MVSIKSIIIQTEYGLINSEDLGMQAFVEIDVKSGKVKDVLAELRRMRTAVEHVCAVTGHCDILATVELPDLDAFSEFLTEKIQRLDGVIRTETLVCITSENRKR